MTTLEQADAMVEEHYPEFEVEDFDVNPDTGDFNYFDEVGNMVTVTLSGQVFFTESET